MATKLRPKKRQVSLGQNLTDLQNSFTVGKSMKFAKKDTHKNCPPHLQYVAALPRKITEPNLVKSTLCS